MGVAWWATSAFSRSGIALGLVMSILGFWDCGVSCNDDDDNIMEKKKKRKRKKGIKKNTFHTVLEMVTNKSILPYSSYEMNHHFVSVSRIVVVHAAVRWSQLQCNECFGLVSSRISSTSNVDSLINLGHAIPVYKDGRMKYVDYLGLWPLASLNDLVCSFRLDFGEYDMNVWMDIWMYVM